MNRHLILIGLPGSGKTTVASAVGELLALPVCDTDEMLEISEGLSIPEIFRVKGEGYFREKELFTVKTACFTHFHTHVIATGGGVVELAENRELLRSSGVVFWLDRPVEKIMSTDFTCGRPLLTGGEAALRELAHRRPLYQQCAHYRIGDGTVSQMASQIAEIWQNLRETPVF